jgi:hypothetical protein
MLDTIHCVSKFTETKIRFTGLRKQNIWFTCHHDRVSDDATVSKARRINTIARDVSVKLKSLRKQDKLQKQNSAKKKKKQWVNIQISRSHLKILGARRVTWIKFHTGYLTTQNLDAMTTRCTPLPEVHELYTFQKRMLRTLGGHTILENSAYWGGTHPLR